MGGDGGRGVKEGYLECSLLYGIYQVQKKQMRHPKTEM